MYVGKFGGEVDQHCKIGEGGRATLWKHIGASNYLANQNTSANKLSENNIEGRPSLQNKTKVAVPFCMLACAIDGAALGHPRREQLVFCTCFPNHVGAWLPVRVLWAQRNL